MSEALFDFAPQINSLAPGQWRLTRIEVSNWGTLTGTRVITVPRKGLLITGESGSGKSTLLDALTTLLVPDQSAKYNAAASGGVSGDTARSRISYVRGAYAQEVDENTNEARTVHLRKGFVVSGIALIFSNGEGKTWTGMRIFYAPAGAANNSQLTNGFFSFDFDQPLKPVLEKVKDGKFVRAVKQSFPGAKSSENSASFHAVLLRKIGIGSEIASGLLHKTLATKNVNSLDKLMREYMLEEPTTKRNAETAVEQFQNLRLAHEDVVKAKKQIELLKPLHQLQKERETGKKEREESARLSQLLPTYRAYLLKERAGEEKQDLETQVATKRDELTTLKQQLKTAETEYKTLQSSYQEQGGAVVELLESKLETQRERQAEIINNREKFQAGLSVLGSHRLPETAEELHSLFALVKNEITGINDRLSEQQAERDQLKFQEAQEAGRRSEIRQELESLAKRRSSIPTRLVDVRTQLAQALQINETALPFAGELIDVTSPQWRGAIEKLLRPLGVSLLVAHEHAQAVAKWINERRLEDRHGQGVDFTYLRLPEALPQARGEISENRVIFHLQVADHAYRGWVVNEIFDRYNYECVETAENLAKVEYGLTQAGLIKGGAKHRKNDRQRIDDRRNWVLGSSNHEVVEALQEELGKCEETLSKLGKDISVLEKRSRTLTNEQTKLERLLETRWIDLNETEIKQQIHALTQQIQQAQENKGLAELHREISLAETKLKELQAAERKTDLGLDRAQQALEQAEEKLTKASLQLGDYTFNASDLNALEIACRKDRRSIRSLDPVDAFDNGQKTLAEKEKLAAARVENSERKIYEIQVNYVSAWTQYATNLVASLDALNDFVERLNQLESDNLPKFETKFRQLLSEQTQNEISNLVSELKNYFKRVAKRIDPVNGSLSQTPYNAERRTFLRLVPTYAPSLEARQFMKDLEQITQRQFNVSGETIAEAEARFARIEAIMLKLSSQERAMVNWRSEVLDTRRHVTFRAEEYNQDGDVVDVYESSAGRSGGQSQKLVTFALAAALRYQLADPGSYIPRYGTVVLDEAFDKTDAHYARASLEIFKSFGFQLILASPLKMNQTVEPYVGGVVQMRLDENHQTELAISVYTEVAEEKATGVFAESAAGAAAEVLTESVVGAAAESAVKTESA